MGCIFHSVDISSASMNPFKEWVHIAKFYKIIKSIRPVIIFNFTPKSNIYCSLACRLLNTDAILINNIAGLGKAFIRKNIKYYILLFLYKISQKKTHTIFFQNNEDLQLFKKYKIIKNNYARIPGSGVDLDRFTFDISKSTPSVNNFLFSGRLLEEKGISLYINAARELKKQFNNLNFFVAGYLDFSQKSCVNKLLFENAVSDGIINYLGPLDDITIALNKIDCIVLPSYYREGVPKSLLEAGAMGKIIVTTNNIGCKETVIDNETGLLCIPRSLDDLIEKIKYLLQKPHTDIIEMKIKAHSFISTNFDEKIIINEYLKFDKYE